MKNGYYLSAYIDVDKLSSAYMVSERHDHTVSLWKKEEQNIALMRYWELERITGYKQHSVPFANKEQAINFINELLDEFNLSVDDMEEIWGVDALNNNLSYTSLEKFPEYAYHTMGHAFTGLLMDSEKFYNDKILAFAVDAAPDTIVDKNGYDRYLYAGVYSDHGKIQIFPVLSPAVLWLHAAQYFKLREGSLMALASASAAKAKERCCSIEGITYENLREWEQNNLKKITDFIDSLEENDDRVDCWDDRFSFEDNKISIAMKEIQQLSLEIMEYNVENMKEKCNIIPNETILSVTGGFALNCPCNSYLMKKYKFKGYMAPPCVSDTGMSMGIALIAFYNQMPKIQFKMENAFYGMSDKTSIEELMESSFAKFIDKIDAFDLEVVAEDIINAPIVWINGNAEVGPRALGNRSILGDPRQEVSKDLINTYKKRQWWRPVAPIILDECIEDYFDDAYQSPYMLHTFYVKNEKCKLIPSVLHLDNSARVQTLREEQNPTLYQVIKKLYEKTGVPIICNTSLNDAGEPIINTAYEAINFALRKNIDIVYYNKSRIKLCNHSEYTENSVLKRNQASFADNKDNKEIIEELNPYNISSDIIKLMIEFPEPFGKCDITNEEDAKKVKLIGRYILKQSMSEKGKKNNE